MYVVRRTVVHGMDLSGRTEVGDGLEQLGRQREADGGNVGDTNEPGGACK